TLKVVAVKAPGFGDRRKEMLIDIERVTGGKLIAEEKGLKLENTVLADLGQAKRIVVDKDNTTLVGGKGKTGDIQGRITEIKAAAWPCSGPSARSSGSGAAMTTRRSASISCAGRWKSRSG